MIVPVLGSHQNRNQQKCQSARNTGTQCVRNIFFQSFIKRQYANSNPDGECVKRSCISVVTFARLQRRLIQINHNGKSCHEKQKKHGPQIFSPVNPSVVHENDTDNPKNQREKVILVFGFVVSIFLRKIILIA